MKAKHSFKTMIALIALGLLTFFGALLALFMTDVKTTYASTVSGLKYKTSGSYSTGGDYQSGCPSNFSINIYTTYNTGSGTAYNGKVLNWSYVFINCEVDKLTEHVSFKLVRDGKSVVDYEIVGKNTMMLYSGSLADGNYELTYVGKYNPNIFSKTTYTYKYSFVIDKTEPVTTLKGGTTTLSSGSYTNQQITFTANDAYKDYCIYYKKPGYSSYYTAYQTSFSVPATSANNGWWYFYSEDYYYNTSSVVSVYLDTVAPTGSVKANGSTVSNGGYTNKSFSYSATDIGGVSYCQVKYPSSSSWTSYSSGSTLTGSNGTGWYTFRAVDKAGNTSAEYKVYYDSGLPTGTVYGGTTSKSSGSYTNASYVKYIASDSYSGIANCYVKMPGSSSYTGYASGTQLATEGTYYFYSVDRSGNSSATLSITLDRTNPTGTLYGGTSAIRSGDHTNADYIKFVPYDTYGVNATYVKKPGSSGYVSYTSGTQYTAEGEYSFYCVDKAGNSSSTYTVTVDRKIPSAQLYADGKAVPNGSYTNASHINFVSDEDCYVKIPGSGTFTAYMSGAEYYNAGKYTFYAVDSAGNNTGNYSIVVDRTAKSVTATNVSGGKTDGDVTLTWTDGNADTFAPITSVEINGKPYAKGSVIHTINTGVYKVVSTDAAGNQWETRFTSSKVNVLTKTLQKEYYETYDANGEPFAFTCYDNAFAFAIAREKILVKTGNWNNSSWDAGIAMDAKDSVNAKNGIYYIYKHFQKGDETVAYFTEERLTEVIEKYAAESLTSYYYWEKEHAEASEGEDLYSYSNSRKILADSIQLADDIHCSVDGVDFIGKLYDTEGSHIMRISDDWGNTCDYEIIVVRRAPVILYMVGEGDGIEVTFDRSYFFKDGITVSISDVLDEYAMFSVYDGAGELLGNFSLADACVLDESGTYTVVAVNHFGQSETFELTISRSAPVVTMEKDADAKRLEISITESADDVSHLNSLEIYKKTGEGWELLAKDDYGTPIVLGTYIYHFRTSGKYRVLLTDEFRTGFDAIEEILDYVQPTPVGTLIGVADGGITNGAVSFEWEDEATVTLTLDGASLEYTSGTELSADGFYRLVFENYDGYSIEYTFTIDTLVPEVQVVGVENGMTVSGDVTVDFTEEDGVTRELYKDGVCLGEIEKGTLLTESGVYTVVVTDLAGNKSEVNFTIDKFVDYEIDINDKGLANSVTVKEREYLEVVLTKDGEAFEYQAEVPLVECGDYVLVLTDELGNEETISFTIIKPLVKEFEHNFDDMPGFERVVMGGEEKRLNYGTLELFEDGTYEVGVVVNGKMYVFTVTVDGTAPSLEIAGVENGGSTKGSVILDHASEDATIQVYLNDEETRYALGDEIAQAGNYRVVVTDVCGNVTEYAFEIQSSLSAGIIALIVIGSLVVVGAVVVFILKKRRVI